MSEPDLIRVWGAMMTEDGPVCDVRDIPGGMTIGEMSVMDPGWRPWAYSSLRAGYDRAGHSRGPECKPGRPCKNCKAEAQTWWWEYGKRTKQRHHKAASDNGKNRTNGWRKDEWGTERATLDEAIADARAAGWRWVLTYDGHGNHLAWSEVPK